MSKYSAQRLSPTISRVVLFLNGFVSLSIFGHVKLQLEMVGDLNYKWLKHSPTYLLQFGMFKETLQIVGPQNLEST